jgi:hypothetical protein
MLRVSEIFEKFRRIFLQVCLLDLLGTWLDGQTKNGGVGQIAQSYQQEPESGKGPRRKRTVGLFSNIPTRLCIESWSLWFNSVVPGG